MLFRSFFFLCLSFLLLFFFVFFFIYIYIYIYIYLCLFLFFFFFLFLFYVFILCFVCCFYIYIFLSENTFEYILFPKKISPGHVYMITSTGNCPLFGGSTKTYCSHPYSPSPPEKHHFGEICPKAFFFVPITIKWIGIEACRPKRCIFDLLFL